MVSLSYHGDDAMDMLEMFYEIDADDNGFIDIVELRKYLTKKGANESDVQRLMKTLDENHDGKITLDEFKEGIEIGDKYFEKPKSHSEDIHMMNSEGVSFHRQYLMINIVRRALHLHGDNNKDVAKSVKTHLDSEFGKLWHVIMLKGQYWAFYSHEPENSMVFKYKGIVYILFRTPN